MGSRAPTSSSCPSTRSREVEAGVWGSAARLAPDHWHLPLSPQGAKFAWESAGSGLEVCPEDVYGAQEIHINGAVLLAFQLYYYTTQVRRPFPSHATPGL